MTKNNFFTSIAIVTIISLCGLLFFTNRSEAVTPMIGAQEILLTILFLLTLTT